MIFREFGCDQAEGIILAHTLRIDGRVLKKGRVLDAEDVAALRATGLSGIPGARLEPGDLPEDEAAGAIGRLLAGDHVLCRKPFTGRCNIHALRDGVMVLDRPRLERLNLVDEAVTVATLPPYTVVREGDIVATVKIIPFAVSEPVVRACLELSAEETAPIRVAPFQPRRAALISTVLPGLKESVLARTREATRARLETLHGRLALDLVCPHEKLALVQAIAQAIAAGCDLVLISGATISKDRGDVVPAAIAQAGGIVIHFGMPVEPGNMLLLARIGPVPIVNLPGCGRSRKENGLDWVLQRLVAGLTLTPRDIREMGVGGLIQGSSEDEDVEKQRPPLPRRAGGRQSAPVVGAVVLAAGSSSRAGDANKLLAPVGGIPMVMRAVNAALASRAASVTVVTGFEAERVRAILCSPRIRFAHNPDHAKGMASSLACGLRALPAGTDAVLIMLGDMPYMRADHLDRLIDAFESESSSIIAPWRGGRRGNPVLWPRDHFDDLLRLSGDIGARQLLSRLADRVTRVEMPDDGVLIDLDTSEALAAAVEARCS
ncbi:MAG: NTP transferase domain-containing protein [Betaproteobacteria bacterium]|nr:NTP transferase domain-containing protein [Betaproteobacteria bacterium]